MSARWAAIGLVAVSMGVAGWAVAAEREGTGLAKVRVAGNRLVTGDGKAFVPFGINYYRPGTGWAPKVWKQFDAEATRADFAKLKALGGNCVRVFLTFGSFYNEPGTLDEEGLVKFDRFLALAEEAGLYVHPTGPDHWEGRPAWANTDPFADEKYLQALEEFWRKFAARYKGRNVLFAYDLLNEPMVRWQSEAMQPRWTQWVVAKHGSLEKAAATWGTPAPEPGTTQCAMPAADAKGPAPLLLDYQLFREELADAWTRRQAEAIRSADPEALVTVGFIQWSVPAVLPRPDLYGAFNPHRQAKFLDFLEIHFYPLERGAYQYNDEEAELRNLAYAEAIVLECARTGKPVVVAEYGWHGGGTFPMGNEQSRHGTEEDQARWCEQLIRTTAGLACGWLNWGFHDHPQARDVSARTGLLTVDGQEKAWGKRFRELAREYAPGVPVRESLPRRPELPWDRCRIDPAAAEQFRAEYLRACREDRDGHQGSPR